MSEEQQRADRILSIANRMHIAAFNLGLDWNKPERRKECERYKSQCDMLRRELLSELGLVEAVE